jgi:hypothetical protein
MADGYEPTSAVSQNAAAGAAMFGAQQPSQGLGYAQLQQQRQLSQQGMQADERRAAEDVQRFEKSQGLAREQLQFGREQMQQNLQEGKEERDSRLKLQQDSQQFQQQLQTQMLERNKQLKMAELEFAKANAQRREALAPQLMKLRKDAADISGKVGAYKILREQAAEKIKGYTDEATKLRGQMVDANKQERAIGERAAKTASDRMYEDLKNNSKDAKSTIRNLVTGIFSGTPLEFVQGDLVNVDQGDIGYDLLKVNEDLVDIKSGSFPGVSAVADFIRRQAGANIDAATGGLSGTASNASAFLGIDDSKVSTTANMVMSKNLSRAISEVTGDKIPPDSIREMLESVIKAGDDVGDQAVLLNKFSEIGVSPEVMKSALLNLANSLDSTDTPGPGREGAPLNRASIMAQMEQTAPGSANRIALEATLKMVDSIQQRARTAAANLPTQDLGGIDSMISYLQRAASGGGRIDRNELAGLVPAFAGGTQDESLASTIREDRQLAELESLGMDPLGELKKRISTEGKSAEQIGFDIEDLQRQLDPEYQSVGDIDTLLDQLRSMK